MEIAEQDLHSRLTDLQSRIRSRKSAVRTADAVKTALILPMIQAIGYDPFDPFEVVPGFTHEGSPRVDYAIRDGDDIRMAIMLTSAPADLSSERSVAFLDACDRIEAKSAVLTDGSVFRLLGRDDAGSLDLEPLLSVDFADQRPVDISGFEHIHAGSFDMAALVAGAAERRSREAILRAIGDELADPSDYFVSAIGARLAAAEIAVPTALHTIISAITLPLANHVGAPAQADAGVTDRVGESNDELALSAEEVQAFHIIQAICARHIAPDRVVARPAKSYLAILHKDNNRRTIARVHWKAQSVKHIGVFAGDNKETKVKVISTADIFNLEAQIVARIHELEAMDAED
jgi:hypothetical protein